MEINDTLVLNGLMSLEVDLNIALRKMPRIACIIFYLVLKLKDNKEVVKLLSIPVGMGGTKDRLGCLHMLVVLITFICK
jgi:hypothetical protein